MHSTRKAACARRDETTADTPLQRRCFLAVIFLLNHGAAPGIAFDDEVDAGTAESIFVGETGDRMCLGQAGQLTARVLNLAAPED